jgi:signal peptidase I
MRFAEVDAAVQRDVPTAAERRRARWSLGFLCAIALAIALRTYGLGTYAIKGDGVNPEIPKNSWVLTWKMATVLSPGDLIVYRSDHQFWVGRVVEAQGNTVRVNRNGTPDFTIERQAVRGRVVSVLWRGTPEKKETP